MYILVAPMFLFLSVIAIRNAIKSLTNRFLIWGLLPYTIGAILTALTVGKIGSDINYFLGLTCVFAIWTAGICLKKPDRLLYSLLILHNTWVIAINAILFQVPLVKLWYKIPEFEREITSRNFPLILIYPAFQQECWPTPVYDAIRQNYVCKEQTGMPV
jgi:hypothetical protein